MRHDWLNWFPCAGPTCSTPSQEQDIHQDAAVFSSISAHFCIKNKWITHLSTRVAIAKALDAYGPTGISSNTVTTETEPAQEMKKNLFDVEKRNFDDWTSVYSTNAASVFFTSGICLT